MGARLPSSLCRLECLGAGASASVRLQSRLNLQPTQPTKHMNRLLKFAPWLLLAAAIFAVAGYYVIQNLDNRHPVASIPRLNRAEQSWYEGNIQNYRIVLEVEFGEEDRLHTVTVRDGQFAEATIAYRQGRDWGPQEAMGEEQARFFTVPGLYETVRSAIHQGLRQDVRMVVNPGPAYPQLIILGPVVQDGFLVAETEARITVLEFIQLK